MKHAELADLSIEALLARAVEAAHADASADGEERWLCVEALQERRESEVLVAALAWCAGKDSVERALGADVLGQSAWADAAQIEASVEQLVTLLSDPAPEVLAAALIGLGQLEAGDPGRLSLLAEHESEDVRHGVASALGSRTDEVSLQTQILLTLDDEPDVRVAATFGLASLCELDTAPLREALRARLDDPEPEVRGEALVGLARRGDAGAVEGVLRELRHTPSLLAVRAAGLCASRELIEELEGLARTNPDDAEILDALKLCRV